MYNGIRHFIFLLPPICVLGGIAGGALLRWLTERSQIAAAAAGIAMVAGLALPVSAMIALHPYQYTYFNSVTGGIRAADKSYMLDYWGLSFKQATDELLGMLDEQGIRDSRRTPLGRGGVRPASSGRSRTWR